MDAQSHRMRKPPTKPKAAQRIGVVHSITKLYRCDLFPWDNSRGGDRGSCAERSRVSAVRGTPISVETTREARTTAGEPNAIGWVELVIYDLLFD